MKSSTLIYFFSFVPLFFYQQVLGQTLQKIRIKQFVRSVIRLALQALQNWGIRPNGLLLLKRVRYNWLPMDTLVYAACPQRAANLIWVFKILQLLWFIWSTSRVAVGKIRMRLLLKRLMRRLSVGKRSSVSKPVVEKIRVSKLLSELGLCSRREADSYIEQGLVTVDGELVQELGTRAYRHQAIELRSGLSANRNNDSRSY